jgi:hypothetical protein
VNQNKHSQLTVVEQVYFQQVGDQPAQFGAQWSRRIATDEQPYQRRMKVGPEWKPIDRGWITNCELLLIENNEGRFTQTNPSDEERKAAASKVVEVGLLMPIGAVMAFARIKPGESCRFQPCDLDFIMIRCRQEASITITLIPGNSAAKLPGDANDN